MRYFSDGKVLGLPSLPDSSDSPNSPEPIVGAVLGGTGQYSNVIGGEFHLTERTTDSEYEKYELKLIACSDEPASSPTTNDEEAPIQKEEDFEFTITKVNASIRFDELRSDVTIDTTGLQTRSWRIIKTGTLHHSQDQNPSNDSNEFITIHCIVLDRRRGLPTTDSTIIVKAENQTCHFDLVYGNNEQGEPNSIFLKATASILENFEIPIGETGGGINILPPEVDSPIKGDNGLTIDAIVLGGTGIYRSAGGEARITLGFHSGEVSGDGVIQTGTIHVELIPYNSGVDLWGDE